MENTKESKDKKRTRRWGDILLFKETLTLPKGVTRVGNIKLHGGSSLTLPEGATQVKDIVLSGGSSLVLPEGVTQVGNIALIGGSSLSFPEGVTRVGTVELDHNSSLTLPKGVTQMGGVFLSNGSSFTLPEGVTQVGKIVLYGGSSFTLPKDVTQVGDISLYGSRSSLTLPEGVTKVGNIYLEHNSSLTLPEGVTQVGGLTLNQGASITFPDGYVLKNNGDNDDDVFEYSAETMNQRLSEHQKFLEKETPMSMQAGETKEPVSESMVEQTIDPEGLQGQRMFVVYPEDVSEGHPLPMSVEGRLTNDGKAYVSFSDSNRIVPKDGLIMVKNPNCNIYEAFDRKTFDLLYQMNHDGTASRKKQSETMKPGMRKKSLLKK